MRKFNKFAMQTHLEVQEREDIRRDLAERKKFVPRDLRAGEYVFYWQYDPSKIQQGRKSGKWLKVGNHSAIKGSMAVVNNKCDHVSGKHKQAQETVGHCGFGKNFQTRVSEQERLCCGSLVNGQIDVWEMFSDNSYFERYP